MQDSDKIRALVSSMAQRDKARTEATLQAEVRELLLTAPLGLDGGDVVGLEAPVEGGRRIDVEVGFTVIEVKKDLRKGKVREDAIKQLAGYVRSRTVALGQRYIGVLTDGAEWLAYQLQGDDLTKSASLLVAAQQPDVDALLVWLEGVLATAQDLTPTPREIQQRLGANSSSHALDEASLTQLYVEHMKLPSIELKRQLWARLLTTALGTQFEDTDELFIQHTLLVNTAEIIAHAVVGLDVKTLAPATLLGGRQFDLAKVYGVVESDFFDWVLEVPEGDGFVRTLARRLSRFDWGSVDHDVLKVLYESVITPETRKNLGEYYTPDWLAQCVVRETITEPLTQRAIDPACGSGTFLFWAVRQFLKAAADKGMLLNDTLAQLSNHIVGVDLHPVAVALARVTYLLAIGRDRLKDPTRGPITVPVYLGDSLQWRQQLDLYTGKQLVVPVDERVGLFASELRFPDHLLQDAAKFDQVVAELDQKAASHKKGRPFPELSAIFRRLGIADGDRKILKETFELLCELHVEGRNHIWSYYVRNLARPLWLSKKKNRFDVMVGNPPWLAYRFMPSEMKKEFRKQCADRGLWHGGEVATNQELSALFVVRCTQRYLLDGGRFGMVMPSAALHSQQYVGFRKGEFNDQDETCAIAFDQPWDMRGVRPHFFPRASCVVFGVRRPSTKPRPMSAMVSKWSGKLPAARSSWAEIESAVTITTGELTITDESVEGSPYGKRFSQGCTLVPRVLFLVDCPPSGPLGLPSGEVQVKSRRSAYEKMPWKDLEPLDGVVESDFMRDAVLGDSVLPFRMREAYKCIIPLEGNKLLDGDHPRIDMYPRLADWWRRAEQVWVANRQNDNLSLVGQLDFRAKLTNQVPASPERVVYAASGMHIAASRLLDPRAVIEHSLYWATAADEAEAHFLCAILNSPSVTTAVRPLMSYGKDERHVDKYVWQLPIPQFNAALPEHAELAELGAAAETEVAALDLDETKHVPGLRRCVRAHLAQSAVGKRIDRLVSQLLRQQPV